LIEENIKLEKRIKELETANYPSEEEAEKAEKTVGNAESKIVSNANTVTEKTKMIEELKNRSKELQRQINQLKDEEQKNGKRIRKLIYWGVWTSECPVCTEYNGKQPCKCEYNRICPSAGSFCR